MGVTKFGRSALAFVAVVAGFWAGSADAAIRIATYNVNDDTGRADPTAYVVQAIRDMAARSLAGNAQALDVINLQEMRYASTGAGVPSVTLTNIVNGLNAVYGAGTYAYDTRIARTNGDLTGNGPNGLVYNTKTIKLLSSVEVAAPSASAGPRAPQRYQLQATGYGGANTFYLYNEHTKSGGTASDVTRRQYEADAVRANADALGSGAHIIYAGDFNLTGGSNDPAYRDLTAPAGAVFGTNGNPNDPNAPLIVAGPAQGIDPQTSTFGTNRASVKYATFSANSLSSRLDLQLSTANVQPSNYQPGLQLVPQTYTAFGNSYYDANGNLVSTNQVTARAIDSDPASYNTAVTGYTADMLANLRLASDHLPVLADYVIAVPEPGALVIVSAVTVLGLRRRRV